QPLEGLTFTAPVLCDGGVMIRLSAGEATVFHEVAPLDEEDEDGRHRLVPLPELFTGFLGWNPGEVIGADGLPEDLILRIAEEGTELRPHAAIARRADEPPEEL